MKTFMVRDTVRRITETAKTTQGRRNPETVSMSAGSIRRGSGTVTKYLLYTLRDGMKDSLMEALHNASREELIDMIEERMDMEPAFRKIVEHRLKSDAASDPDKQIRAFQNQVMEEMTRRHPDTTVIRFACNVINRQMESWPAADCCRGCIAIIRTLDSAYANGAGTEDDTDYLISMDIESAAEYAKTRIRLKTLPDSEAEKITAMLKAETRKPLEAFGDFIFTDILDGMRES